MSPERLVERFTLPDTFSNLKATSHGFKGRGLGVDQLRFMPGQLLGLPAPLLAGYFPFVHLDPFLDCVARQRSYALPDKFSPSRKYIPRILPNMAMVISSQTA